MGWPVYTEIRLEESANGARCISRRVPGLEAHFQAPKAYPAGVSGQAPTRPPAAASKTLGLLSRLRCLA